jgi:hypothetical protein
VPIFQQVQTCEALGMKLVDPKTPDEWSCILKEIGKLGKTSISSAKNSDFDLIKISDFGDSVSIHVPISDRNCMNKWVLCGSGRPFGKEYMDAYTDDIYLREDGRHRSCAAIWKQRDVANNRLRIYREQCERFDANIFRRKVICEVPVKT